MIGIDLVLVPRMKDIVKSEYGEQFIGKIFTEKEKNSTQMTDPATRALTASELFAIKEAVIKASTQKLTINDLDRIEIGLTDQGPLMATVLGGDEHFCVSVDFLGEYVFAVAVSSGP